MRYGGPAGTLPGVSTRRGPFHFKDVFTLVNLVSGVIAVRFVLQDRPRMAGYAVIVGYLLGDLLDGFVARATKTSNRFGAEFDSIVDHFVHVVVPGLIIYNVYSNAGHGWLGLSAMGILVGSATLRHARLAAARFDFPLCWCGLPRTVSGFAAMAVPLSHLLQHNLANRHWLELGFVVIAVLSILNLVPIPYMTHRGRRAMQPVVKLGVALFVVTPVLVFFFDRTYTFDVFLVFVLGYALVGWMPVHPDERRDFYREYRRWSAALAA